jgi:hypothetical protein
MITVGAEPTVTVSLALLVCPELSVAVMVMVCVPTWFDEGVHEKYPDELMLLFETDEPPKESLTEYEGFEKPEVTALKESVMPGVIELLGESDWIERDSGAVTVICSCTTAELPDESCTLMVSVCVPTSPLPGVHEKLPDELMLPPETDEPLNESLTL